MYRRCGEPNPYLEVIERLDFIEMQKCINILNVAYHLCLEIVETKGTESKAICPFCRL